MKFGPLKFCIILCNLKIFCFFFTLRRALTKRYEARLALQGEGNLKKVSIWSIARLTYMFTPHTEWSKERSIFFPNTKTFFLQLV